MTRILIIDDYKEIRDLYGEALRTAGFEVTTRETGELGALEILNGGYDLILLDMLMPRRDGLWVLDEIQGKTPQKPNGKIILMGLKNDEDNHQVLFDEAKKKGAADFLDKRISVENELIPKIKFYLQNI